jgi:hypothetical protein
MSRHTIAHATKEGHFFIVGYDRPLDRFFLQVWRPRDEQPHYVDYDFDLDDLATLKAEVPKELRDVLIKEAAGESDTQAIFDWRLPADQRDLRAAAQRLMEKGPNAHT